MSIGFWQIAVVVILVVLLFGRGKISSLMGDVAKGIKSFKKGMSTDALMIQNQKIFQKINKTQVTKTQITKTQITKTKSHATNWLV